MSAAPVGTKSLHGLVARLFIGCCLLVLSGCSAMNLLEGPLPSSLLEKPNLALPPGDNFVRANAAPETPGQNDGNGEPALSGEATVPTVEELASVPVAGIDAAQTAVNLEADRETAKVDQSIKWRGKFDGESVDIANVSGTLCTGPTTFRPSTNRASGTITLACSDGRIAQLNLGRNNLKGTIHFGKENENVEIIGNN